MASEATPSTPDLDSDPSSPEVAASDALETGSTTSDSTTSDSTTSGTTGFAELGLHPILLERLEAGGYQAPTPIQAQAIPSLLGGRDVVGQAQTGTGKTAAFSLPLLQHLDIGQRKVQGLILCPTRELALQVTDALANYGAARKVRVLTVYGGAPIHKQLSRLKSGVHVVVGTPGRVKDCIARGALSLAMVRHVVLDEADEMLRMGFLEDVEEILGHVPEERQTALFSATLPPAIARVAEKYLRDPVRVKIEQKTRTVDRIDQRVIVTNPHDKLDVLARVIEAEPIDAVLVFARTRAGCGELVDQLRKRGVRAAALHGDLTQEKREAIVARLRARDIQLVVATDIAARGLDVEGITHVINYDPPSEPEVYVHRIGRTGRAGREGISISLLTPRERRVQRAIEGYTGQRMRLMSIPTNDEIVAGRVARFRTRIQQTIESAELDPYRQVIGQFLEDPEADLTQIAAALAEMVNRARPLQIVEDEPQAPSRGSNSARGPGRDSRESRGKPRLSGDTVLLFVPLGRYAGVIPADLVGAIANEANVPGKSIGRIDVREKVSFIEVRAEDAPTILSQLGKVTIRGRKTSFVIARPGSFERGRTSGGRGGPPPGGRATPRRRPRRETPFRRPKKKTR